MWEDEKVSSSYFDEVLEEIGCLSSSERPCDSSQLGRWARRLSGWEANLSIRDSWGTSVTEKDRCSPVQRAGA